MDTLKIVSGGQTGVDRAALDAAMEHGLDVGGWCPEGRLAEDGKIDEKYPLTVLAGAGYAERTKQNVLDSDGTVILYFGSLQGGTALTAKYCKTMKKPHLLIDGETVDAKSAAEQIVDFIEYNDITVLNVAGPRASKTPMAVTYTESVVSSIVGL